VHFEADMRNRTQKLSLGFAARRQALVENPGLVAENCVETRVLRIGHRD
jgi:hypothetical protein